MSVAVKKSFSQQIIEKIANKLGHEPNTEELSNAVNGTGLLILADSIIHKNKDNIVLFVDNECEEEIVIPDINSEMMCSQCLSYDNWRYVDADWEDNQKWVSYRCETFIKDGLVFSKCDNDIRLFLNENNKPIFPKGKK